MEYIRLPTSPESYSLQGVHELKTPESARIGDAARASLGGTREERDSLTGFDYRTPRQLAPARRGVSGTTIILLFLLFPALGISMLYLRREFFPANPIEKFDSSKLVVMIEKRNLPVLVPLLVSLLAKVPPEWPFEIWVGRDNEGPLQDSRLLHPFQASGKLRFKRIPDEDAIFDGASLSNFTTRPTFWESLAPAHHLFFVQADSFVCSQSNFSLNDFLGTDVYPPSRSGDDLGGYDFVGAPWGWRGYDAAPFGGNGGTSLRRRDSMLAVTRKNVWDGEDAEDLWFSNLLANSTARFPTHDIAMRFSWEGIPCLDHVHPWAWQPYALHIGLLACSHYESFEAVTRLLKWCPDAKLILPNECIPPS